MAPDRRATLGVVLIGLVALGVAWARPAPPAVAARVIHLEGDAVRPGWYEADSLHDAVRDAGVDAAYVASPLEDGDRALVVGPYVVDAAPPPPVQTDAWIPGKLRLNQASLAELEALPRVGPVLAARIVAGRPYRSVGELDRVKGVGPATLARLRPLVAP